MARTVLLTGATGFIGRGLAQRLHARGDKLRCVVRSEARGRELRDQLGADIIVCDLTDVSALTQALTGCELAYHLAAIYDIGVVRADDLQHTNVDGTRAFVDAVERSKVPRAVYTSTTVALGPQRANASETEFREYSGPYPSVYHRTKAEAHRIAREAQERGVPIVIACPAFVYGPGDHGPGGRFILDLIRGRVPALLSDPARFSYVHVDDVVSGLELIGERGRIGATYILSGEERSMNEFAQKVTAVAGVRMPLLRFPPVMAAATGSLLDALTRLTGLKFPITHEGVVTTAHDRWLHSHKTTTTELGWSPRTIDEGLPGTINWVKSGLNSSRA